MALTPSVMEELGTALPPFTLPDVVSGRPITPDSFPPNQPLLVMFICCHCPYVKHIEGELARLGRDYQDKSLSILAISSNDAEHYPDDAPDKLKAMAQNLGFTFPYGYDETQAVAHAFKAACTPDFFLYDANRRLVYRGQLDDSRPGNTLPVTGQDLRLALNAVLTDLPIPGDQKPSIGCNIKWKAGNEPTYS